MKNFKKSADSKIPSVTIKNKKKIICLNCYEFVYDLKNKNIL